MLRQLLGRGVPTETRRLLTNSTASIARDKTTIRCIAISALRCYATASDKTSTKATTAKTTKTPRKKTSTTKNPAKPKATATTTAKSPKKAAAKKPAAKKAAKKPPAKKPVKKTTAKKTTKKSSRPQTDLQKKRTTANNFRRAAMLDGPKMLPVSGYLQFTVNNTVPKGSNDVGAISKTNSATWKAMSESEKERYRSIASQNKLANEQTYKKWIESHTPWEIRVANNARRHLNRLAKEPKPAGARAKVVGHASSLLRDERKLKRQDTPYIAFSRERWGSGDFKNVLPPDGARSISREWNALSKEAKQKYRDVYLEGRSAYAMEYERVYGQKLKQSPAEKKLLKTSAIEEIAS